MVTPFDRTFTDADKDTGLFDMIWADELPGILNRALAGYQRVVERGHKFKQPSPMVAAGDLWLQHANPLPAFIKANCNQKAGGKSPTCRTQTVETEDVDHGNG
jgi:phage/plasmid-associated DNA primase